MDDVVLLVGHGGVPRDLPRAWLSELRQLETARRMQGGEPSARERELDEAIRNFPRSDTTDPYRAGVERIARALAARVAPCKVVVAYNEFCAPSVEQALEQAIAASARSIAVLTTMVTPGGSHAELEIPEALEQARQRHPDVVIRYAWPFSPDDVAELLARQVISHPAGTSRAV